MAEGTPAGTIHEGRPDSVAGLGLKTDPCAKISMAEVLQEYIQGQVRLGINQYALANYPSGSENTKESDLQTESATLEARSSELFTEIALRLKNVTGMGKRSIR